MQNSFCFIIMSSFWPTITLLTDTFVAMLFFLWEMEAMVQVELKVGCEMEYFQPNI